MQLCRNKQAGLVTFITFQAFACNSSYFLMWNWVLYTRPYSTPNYTQNERNDILKKDIPVKQDATSSELVVWFYYAAFTRFMLVLVFFYPENPELHWTMVGDVTGSVCIVATGNGVTFAPDICNDVGSSCSVVISIAEFHHLLLAHTRHTLYTVNWLN